VGDVKGEVPLLAGPTLENAIPRFPPPDTPARPLRMSFASVRIPSKPMYNVYKKIIAFNRRQASLWATKYL